MFPLAHRPAVLADGESRSATCMTLPQAVIGSSSSPENFLRGPQKIPAVGPRGQRIKHSPLPGKLEFDVMVRKWPDEDGYLRRHQTSGVASLLDHFRNLIRIQGQVFGERALFPQISRLIYDSWGIQELACRFSCTDTAGASHAGLAKKYITSNISLTPTLLSFSSTVHQHYPKMTILTGRPLHWAITAAAGSGFLLCT